MGRRLFVLLFAEEISRQLNNSDAKIIFGLASMSKTLKQAVEMTKRPIRIIYVKAIETELLPAGGIDLQDLTATTGEIYEKSPLEGCDVMFLF